VCFCENSNAGKAKLNKFLLIYDFFAGFIEVNISDTKLGKYYFTVLAELNKYGFQCSASVRAELKHSGD